MSHFDLKATPLAAALVLSVIVVCGVSLTMGARSSEPVSAAPEPAATPTGGLAVRTCAEDVSWVRPSEAQMAQTVWQDNRYRDAGGAVPRVVREYFDRNFVLFATPTGSGVSHAMDMTGVSTAGPPSGSACGSGADPALIAGREVAIWALGYHVRDAHIRADTLVVTVEPHTSIARGYHIVQIARPASTSWTVRFELAGGSIVAEWTSTDGDLTARPASQPCTGEVVGRIVLGYGTRAAVPGLRLQLSGLDPQAPSNMVFADARTDSNGQFRIQHVPLGEHDGAALHARFVARIERCGQRLDLGDIAYPLIHPDWQAMAVFEAFMQARVDRQTDAVLGPLVDALQTRSVPPEQTLWQLSNPCWYRYAVVSVDQPSGDHVIVQTRVFMHWWSGDSGGGIPQSRQQEIGLVRLSGGWRVEHLSNWQPARDEPGEMHGETLSACSAARQKPASK